jgi:hypothetical protein
LKQFDQIARGVRNQDLLAARTAHNVAAEGNLGGAKPVDLSCEVIHDEVDPIPTSGCRHSAVWLRLGT